LLPLVLSLWTLTVPATVRAHEVRPALLQITQTAPSSWSIFWKQPAAGEVALRLTLHLSSGWLEAKPTDQYVAPGFLVRTWQVNSSIPLLGQSLTIEGLDQTITDVFVQVSFRDGRHLDAVVKPDQPRLLLVMGQKAESPAVMGYLRLGIDHIAAGIDHLLFVLGLLLLVGLNRQIIKTVSAFTVAHSLTLTAAALGLVNVPTAVIEALVALSIVFVAVELLARPGQDKTLLRRHPWLVAFVFGLLHGFAFAGALEQIGLPPSSALLSLLLFNIGVEIGQLAFIALAVVMILILRRLRERLPWDLAPAARLTPAYGIGCFASFWFIERLIVAFQ
jgi:hydrogenase/urease accessory protein HupE